MKKVIFLGNAVYRKETHGGYSYDCFLPSGLSPTLNCACGGSATLHNP